MQLAELLGLSRLELDAVAVLAPEQLSPAAPSECSPKSEVVPPWPKLAITLLALAFADSPVLPANVVLQLLLAAVVDASAPFLFSPLLSFSWRPHVQQSVLVFRGRLPSMQQMLGFCLALIS